MENRENKINIYIAVIVVLIAAFMRLINHPANFAPVGAIALFSGIYLEKKFTVWLPLFAMVLSDMFIGFDSLLSRYVVYGSFIGICLIGLWVRNNKTFSNIVFGSLAGSTLFFLFTNLVFLYPPVMYSHDFSSQINSYVNALPFFKNTLLSDLFYIGVFAGTYEMTTRMAEKRAYSVAALKK